MKRMGVVSIYAATSNKCLVIWKYLRNGDQYTLTVIFEVKLKKKKPLVYIQLKNELSNLIAVYFILCLTLSTILFKEIRCKKNSDYRNSFAWFNDVTDGTRTLKKWQKENAIKVKRNIAKKYKTIIIERGILPLGSLMVTWKIPIN